MARYWVADNHTDIENGWSIETSHPIGSPEFWQACDEELPPHMEDGVLFRIIKAVEIDEDCNWVGKLGSEIVWR
jgi:hypothetical protein